MIWFVFDIRLDPSLRWDDNGGGGEAFFVLFC